MVPKKFKPGITPGARNSSLRVCTSRNENKGSDTHIQMFVSSIIYSSQKMRIIDDFGACPGTSSHRPGWPRTRRDPLASASRVLGLKVCATTAQLNVNSLHFLKFILKVINYHFSLNSSTIQY